MEGRVLKVIAVPVVLVALALGVLWWVSSVNEQVRLLNRTRAACEVANEKRFADLEPFMSKELKEEMEARYGGLQVIWQLLRRHPETMEFRVGSLRNFKEDMGSGEVSILVNRPGAAEHAMLWVGWRLEEGEWRAVEVMEVEGLDEIAP